jgi:nucleoside-diphosphate-sugar epimerase
MNAPNRDSHPSSGTLKGARILITGASGFVGACLVRYMLDISGNVAIMVRPETHSWRIADVINDVRVYYEDVIDKDAVRRTFQDYRPDYVFHLAAYGAYGFQAEPDKIVATNVLGTLHVLNAALEVGCQKVVVTGSSSEYGVVKGKMKEASAPAPVNVYGAAKVSASVLCQTYASVYELPTVVLRLFSVYGAYEEPTRFIASLILAGLRGESPKLTAGEQKRDFIYIGDVMSAFLAAATQPEAIGHIINIGSGKERTLRDVGGEIMRIMGDPIAPQWGALPYREGEMWDWEADISKAKRLLKWAPAYDIKAGLSETVKWFTDNEDLFKKGNQNSAPIRDFRDK